MLKVAKLEINEGTGAAALEVEETALVIDTERVTESSVRRALGLWVGEKGEPGAKYVAVEVLSPEPLSVREKVEIIRSVVLPDGSEAGPQIRKDGSYLISDRGGKQSPPPF